MFDPDEIAARQAGLARHMSERLNALAERVFVQAEAATAPEAVQAAALTVEKLYRGVRLCMGFEARVVREHRRIGREDEVEALKVREDAHAKGVQHIERAVIAGFVADYEADRETSDDPDEDLRALMRNLSAVNEAVTGAKAAIDPTGDIEAQVEELRETALLVAEIQALEAPAPPPVLPPWVHTLSATKRAASG